MTLPKASGRMRADGVYQNQPAAVSGAHLTGGDTTATKGQAPCSLGRPRVPSPHREQAPVGPKETAGQLEPTPCPLGRLVCLVLPSLQPSAWRPPRKVEGTQSRLHRRLNQRLSRHGPWILSHGRSQASGAEPPWAVPDHSTRRPQPPLPSPGTGSCGAYSRFRAVRSDKTSIIINHGPHTSP